MTKLLQTKYIETMSWRNTKYTPSRKNAKRKKKQTNTEIFTKYYQPEHMNERMGHDKEQEKKDGWEWYHRGKEVVSG